MLKYSKLRIIFLNILGKNKKQIKETKYDNKYKPSSEEINSFPDLQNGPSNLIKGSNVLVKSSVILETLINIVWFSTIRLFSKKGVGKKRYADEY